MKKLFCLITALIVTIMGRSQTAEEYNDKGDAKFILQDYAGAIECYNKATELNPNLALAYGSRGFVKNILCDYTGAIKDITKAIELNPNYKYNYEFYYR
ncbi:MAG TPA: tetratricopeptide repeat protein, partial [Bacteroidales bacterium]